MPAKRALASPSRGVTKKLNLVNSVNNNSSCCTIGLITYKKYRTLWSPQIVL